MQAVLPRTSVIIPVFNEAESLPILYKRLKEVLDKISGGHEMVFIDDGSQDESFATLRDISLGDPNVKVIRLRRNFGQTAALVAGFDRANGEIIITIDADLQNDPSDIPNLIDKIDEGYDIVSGWRKNRKDPIITKALPSKLSNKMASWLTGVRLHDFGCTLKAYRREVIEGIHLYGELHRYVPAVASSLGVRVAEIEVSHHPRPFGKSKYGITRLMRGMLDLITLKLLLTYMNRPMQMLGGLGVLSMLGAVTSGMATVAMKLFMGFNMTGNPLLFLTILLFLASVQFISMGFLGEISMRTYHETQSKPIYVVREVVENTSERFSTN